MGPSEAFLQNLDFLGLLFYSTTLCSVTRNIRYKTTYLPRHEAAANYAQYSPADV